MSLRLAGKLEQNMRTLKALLWIKIITCKRLSFQMNFEKRSTTGILQTFSIINELSGCAERLFLCDALGHAEKCCDVIESLIIHFINLFVYQ